MIDRFYHDFANYETAFEVADFEQIFDQVKYDELVEPKKYNGAWNHPDKFQQAKLREAISKEFRDMNRRKVWKKIDRRKIPPGGQCVKQKWVMKIKHNGVFRARLVACGYSQIPSIDFTENYALVISNLTY